MAYKVFADLGSLSEGLAEHVAKLSAAAIADHGRFTVAVSGGSLPILLGKALTKEPYRTEVQWDKWHVLLADERCVALDHEDSNYRLVKEELLNHVPVGTVYPILLAGTTEDTARHYQGQLEGLFGQQTPAFDLILLGMGPDGHTCSLFPGHPLLQEKTLLVAPIDDSPKPPLSRITLTLPVVNNAKAVAYVVTGAGKRDAVVNILKDGNTGNYPAGLVHPPGGDRAVTWFLDKDSGSKLL